MEGEKGEKRTKEQWRGEGKERWFDTIVKAIVMPLLFCHVTQHTCIQTCLCQAPTQLRLQPQVEVTRKGKPASRPHQCYRLEIKLS